MYKLLICIIFLSPTAFSYGSTQNLCADLFPQKRLTKKFRRLVGNEFNTYRTLKEYKEDLGNEFVRALKKLRGRDKVWIDMGAGSAQAQIIFLKARIREGVAIEDLPVCIAVGYKIPNEDRVEVLRFQRTYPNAFRYIEGLQTPETIMFLGKADLITDDVGIKQYASVANLSQLKIIAAYVESLKPGASAFISPMDQYDWTRLPKSIREKTELKNSMIDPGYPYQPYGLPYIVRRP